jgi:hypothetical protein
LQNEKHYLSKLTTRPSSRDRAMRPSNKTYVFGAMLGYGVVVHLQSFTLAATGTYSGSKLTVSGGGFSETHDLGQTINQLRAGGLQIAVKGNSRLGVWWGQGHFSVHQFSRSITLDIEPATGLFAVAGGSLLGVADEPLFWEHDLGRTIEWGIKSTGPYYAVAGDSMLGVANGPLFWRHDLGASINRDIVTSGSLFAAAAGSYLGVASGQNNFIVKRELGSTIQKGIATSNGDLAVAGGRRLGIANHLSSWWVHELNSPVSTEIASFDRMFAVGNGTRLAVAEREELWQHNLGFSISSDVASSNGYFAVAGGSRLGVANKANFSMFDLGQSICELEVVGSTFVVHGRNKRGVWSGGSFVISPVSTCECCGPTPPGDFNGDYEVDAADLNRWKSDFGVNGDSDSDGDGDSDGADFLTWQRNLGLNSATPSGVVVPEPASWLFAIALLAVVGRRR